MNLVVGNPLQHSLSPRLHNFVYGLENIPTTMEKFAEADIKKVVSKVKNDSIELTALTTPPQKKKNFFLCEVGSA